MNPLYASIDASSKYNVIYLIKSDGSKHSNFLITNSLICTRQPIKLILSAIAFEGLKNDIISLVTTSIYDDNLVCFLREDGTLFIHEVFCYGTVQVSF